LVIYHDGRPKRNVFLKVTQREKAIRAGLRWRKKPDVVKVEVLPRGLAAFKSEVVTIE